MPVVVARWRELSVALALVVAACGVGAAATRSTHDAAVETTARAPSRVTSTTSSVPPTTTTSSPPPDPVTTAPAPPAPPSTSAATLPASAPPTAPPSTGPPSTTTTRPHPPRHVHAQAWTPYATVGPLTLRHPADRVEAIGFHQSGHDGAQQQSAAPTAARWFVMTSRDRDTGAQGAADVVVEPGREIRAPVSGTVVRAGAYTLYCDHVDQYAVIDPDGRPGWEVKVLHVEGLAVSRGQRVEAGVTRLAAQARVLPFPSQVEEDTGLPPWPHVHVEVVDPTVPDRPGKGCP